MLLAHHCILSFYGFWLPNDPQPPTKTARCIHDRVFWKRFANLCQRVIQREIPRDDSGERVPLACWLRRSVAANFQYVVGLLHEDGTIPNRTHKAAAAFLPMKDLA